MSDLSATASDAGDEASEEASSEDPWAELSSVLRGDEVEEEPSEATEEVKEQAPESEESPPEEGDPKPEAQAAEPESSQVDGKAEEEEAPSQEVQDAQAAIDRAVEEQQTQENAQRMRDEQLAQQQRSQLEDSQRAAQLETWETQLAQQYSLNEDAAEVLRTSPEELLPRLLARVQRSAWETTRSQILEFASTMLPDIVKGIAKNEAQFQRSADTFFDKWPELKGHEAQVEAALQSSSLQGLEREEMQRQAGIHAWLAAGLSANDLLGKLADPLPKGTQEVPSKPSKPGKPTPSAGGAKVETNIFDELTQQIELDNS